MAEHNNHLAACLPETPHPQLKTLEPLIGRWRIEGPDVSGEIVYEWMEGGFFLIQRFDLENYGERHRGIEYAGWDEETQTIRSRLMGTDGARFTYTYAIEDGVYFYWFGEKGSDIFSRGEFSEDGKVLEGRWTVPGMQNGGYDWRLTRLDPLPRQRPEATAEPRSFSDGAAPDESGVPAGP